MLETVIIDPHTPPTHAVIWLHGLGADGHDFAPIMSELQPPASPTLRFILPHAPTRQVTLFGGMPVRAWFDIFLKDGVYGFIPEEVTDMADQINTLIEMQEREGILPANIFIAGFSQGGAMAMYTALTSTKPIGGVLGLSTFLPIISELSEKASRRFPTFIAHGTADDVVPFSAGAELANALKAAGFPVDWRSYPIGHGVSSEEISDIRNWFNARIQQ